MTHLQDRKMTILVIFLSCKCVIFLSCKCDILLSHLCTFECPVDMTQKCPANMTLFSHKSVFTAKRGRIKKNYF